MILNVTAGEPLAIDADEGSGAVLFAIGEAALEERSVCKLLDACAVTYPVLPASFEQLQC